MDGSQQNVYLATFWIVLVVIGFILLPSILGSLSKKKTTKKVKEESKPTFTPGGSVSSPRTTPKPKPTGTSRIKGTAAGGRSGKGTSASGWSSSKTTSTPRKNVEFKQLYAWGPMTGGVRRCSWCGAEMGTSEKKCPSCGYAN